ncbi:MAG: radical SAM protein [Acidobacteria bacterium]|nr:radical SAM protein [Acidobacteriota bacterium]MBI3657724.1 radical SAM protein [Acidobacteriota bacterium]
MIHNRAGRRKQAVYRRLREGLMIAKGLVSTRHPILAHIIPIRRCNLSCAYCNEYDKVSQPVPLAEMLHRIDRLAFLGTTIITLSGGEPLIHPDAERIIQRIRHHGIIAGVITNGYLLTEERIAALNAAGLDHMQISIDNVEPDDVSKKSLKVLDQKLKLLSRRAEFAVNINSVIGGGIETPEDGLVVARRAVELGFTSTVGIIHDGSGQLRPLSEKERQVYLEIKELGQRSYARFNIFQEQVVRGLPNEWRCRAGARYLYICEDGLVHYCSQQRGYPAIPLADYTPEHLRKEFFTEKSCAPRCTVSCVQQVALFDNWRAPQTAHPRQTEPRSGSGKSTPLTEGN